MVVTDTLGPVTMTGGVTSGAAIVVNDAVPGAAGELAPFPRPSADVARTAVWVAGAAVIALVGAAAISAFVPERASDDASSSVPPPVQAAADAPALAETPAASPKATGRKPETRQKPAAQAANGGQVQPETPEKTETPEKPPSLQAADIAEIRALLNRLAAAMTSERPHQAMPTLGPGAAMVVLKGSSQMKAAFGPGLSVRVGKFETTEITAERIGIRLILLAKSDARPEMPLAFTASLMRVGGEMRFADLQRDWDADGRGGDRPRD